MVNSSDLRPERKMNAAELQGTRNRFTIQPELVRRMATLVGYDKEQAFTDGAPTPLPDMIDLSDITELMLIRQITQLELSPSTFQKKEAEVAGNLLNRMLSNQYLTRSEIHGMLPPETVVAFKMGPRRLWGYAVRQRLPQDAELSVPPSFHRDQTGPYTDPVEAWLGWHVTDPNDLSTLTAVVDDVPTDDNRYQRFRIGMSLADTFAESWSAFRGHWAVSADTRYVVPSRYGWCPYVFRIPEDGWRRDEFEGGRDRLMAEYGYYIDVEHERLIEVGPPQANDCWNPQLKVSSEPPSERDMEVASAITGELVALGSVRKNTITRLRQKGRNLF